MQGYITTFRLAALKAGKIMDDEHCNHFVAGCKPKICERVPFSSAKSFEKSWIAAESAGVVFTEYSGAT